MKKTIFVLFFITFFAFYDARSAGNAKANNNETLTKDLYLLLMEAVHGTCSNDLYADPRKSITGEPPVFLNKKTRKYEFLTYAPCLDWTIKEVITKLKEKPTLLRSSAINTFAEKFAILHCPQQTISTAVGHLQYYSRDCALTGVKRRISFIEKMLKDEKNKKYAQKDQRLRKKIADLKAFLTERIVTRDLNPVLDLLVTQSCNDDVLSQEVPLVAEGSVHIVLTDFLKLFEDRDRYHVIPLLRSLKKYPCIKNGQEQKSPYERFNLYYAYDDVDLLLRKLSDDLYYSLPDKPQTANKRDTAPVIIF